MPNLGIIRTPAEIIERYNSPEVTTRDFLGTERGDLIEALAFEDAKPFLKEGVTPEEWDEVTDVLKAAQDYMDFAAGKAIDHRGLSAGRSVSHYMAWTWLMGVDDQIDWDDYTNYGAPILKKVAEVLGCRWPDDAGLNRMAEGEPCRDDCQDGCGSMFG